MQKILPADIADSGLHADSGRPQGDFGKYSER